MRAASQYDPELAQGMTSSIRSYSDGYHKLPGRDGRSMTRKRRNYLHSFNSHELPSTFLMFLRDASPFLHAFFSSNGVSAADTEDLAQDCLERVIRYRRCRTDELYLLLHRIARNRLADFRKSPRARMERQLASADVNLEDYSPCTDPVRQTQARQMLKSLYQALSTLPKCSREVYLLNRVTGMSYSQIARHRRVAPKTVEKQMSRALQELQMALDQTAFCVDDNS